jgi:CubicO group peptidase (beta-lactamase class C family)
MRTRDRFSGSAGAALIVLAVLAAGLFARASAGKPGASDKPATVRLEAYIETFNSGSLERMKAFIEENFAASALKEAPVAQRLNRYQSGLVQIKSFALDRVVAELDFRTACLVRTGAGQTLLLQATVERTAPHKLLAITAELVEDPDAIVVPEPKANEEEFVEAVRAFLEERARTDAFSGVALVAMGDRVLFHEAYGFADREAKVPNRKDTRFNLGSINKNFTRVAVHQLARQGKLTLEDTIRKFLPDYPNAEAAGKVRVRHLLNMTSGIGDFFGDRYDATPKDRIRTLQDYLPLFGDRPLEFEPGKGNRYSNGGYIVLGLIIEKAAGVDYYTYVRENIFKPCGMTATDSFARDADVPNLAKGYTLEGGTGPGRVLNHETLPGRGSSAGGGYSTAEDLLKYVRAVRDGKVFLPDAAAGLGIAGGAPGINAAVEWDPRAGTVVIVLSNFDPPAAGEAARRIVSWLPQ